MRKTLFVGLFFIFVVSALFCFSALSQANQEQIDLSARLQSRSQLIGDSLTENIEPALNAYATSSIQHLIDKYVTNERLVSLGVFDSAGQVVAASSSEPLPDVSKLLGRVLDSDGADGEYLHFQNKSYYAYVTPLHSGSHVVGALMVVQEATYIDESIRAIWVDSIAKLLILLLLDAAAAVVLVRWAFVTPIRHVAANLEQIRSGRAQDLTHESFFLSPLVGEISKITRSLRQARHAASEEARLRLEKIDSPWTAERLKEFFRTHLKGRQIFVVSNREPYVHVKDKKNKIICNVPPSGMVTALEPVMEACGGTWLAHGSGSADKETVDEQDKIQVPVDEPRYTLKRIWLTEEEVQRYYNGFSNEALWPLCLLAYNRPLFREPDWRLYRQVNGKFAQSLLSEIQNVERPMVLVQDFHLALVPRMIRNSRTDADIALFWHIPWPSAETFSICPWRKEILDGMLGADIVGFHTQQHCLNFMDTVSKEIESIVNFEEFSITRGDHTTYVKAFPISVAYPHGDKTEKTEQPTILEKYNVRTKLIGVGVDRMDYTKGIMEKLKGLEFLFSLHPEYQETFTFVQVAPPSREGVQKYREFSEEVAQEAERINKRFEKNGWKPIVLIRESLPHEAIYPLYRAAQVCLVTSLSDGMNLVAKEYVAAKEDEIGVLVLSQFAGASRELRGGAIILNPYSAEETAEVLHRALGMPPSEQYRRMKKMQNVIKNNNVFRWAAELLKALSDLG